MKRFKIATLILGASLIFGLNRNGYCENRAVIFGCNGSAAGGEKRLDYAESDAQKMVTQLTRSGGLFQADSVRLYTTGKDVGEDRLATRENLLKALKWLGEAGEQDTILFYFSGHGGQGSESPTASEAEKLTRLVTYDYKGDDPATGFPVMQLHEEMNKLKALNGITLLDSCFSGIKIPIARRGGARLKLVADEPTADPGLRARDTRVYKFSQNLVAAEAPGTSSGRNRVLLTSCQAAERSFEAKTLPGSATGGGLFTYFVCKGLSGEANYEKDAGVTSSELVFYVQHNLPNYLATGRSKGWESQAGGSLVQTPRVAGNAADFPLTRVQQTSESPGNADVIRIADSSPPAADFAHVGNATRTGNRFEILCSPGKRFDISGNINAPAGVASITFDNINAPQQSRANNDALPATTRASDASIVMKSLQVKDTSVYGYSIHMKKEEEKRLAQPDTPAPAADKLPLKIGEVVQYMEPESHRKFEVSRLCPTTKQTFVLTIADNLGQKTQYEFAVTPADENSLPNSKAPYAVVCYEPGTGDSEHLKQYGIADTTAARVTQILSASNVVNTVELSSSMWSGLQPYAASSNQNVRGSQIAKCLQQLMSADVLIVVKWVDFELPLNDAEKFIPKFSYTFVQPGMPPYSDPTPLSYPMDQKQLSDFGWPTPEQWKTKYKNLVQMNSETGGIGGVIGHPYNDVVDAIVDHILQKRITGTNNVKGMIERLRLFLLSQSNSSQDVNTPATGTLT